MEEVEAQLRDELRDAVASALETKRPLLTHLNADTTWLLSIPLPKSATHISAAIASNKKRKRESLEHLENGAYNPSGGKSYYHILIDPWLRGGQSDVAKFFSQQWHADESAVQTVAEIEEAIEGIENLAQAHTVFQSSIEQHLRQPIRVEDRRRGAIDAVVVSHEFTDHMHKETLVEVNPSVPVFAPSIAAGRIKSWKHFDVVVSIPPFSSKSRDWRDSSKSPLPSWLGISRLATENLESEALLNYHSAVMVVFGNPDGDEEAEAVIYTPHGISPNNLKPVSMAQPPVRTLALLHGLHDISLGSQLNLGAHNGLKAQRLTGAKYWVGTHDEVKRGGGLVSWFLKRQVLSVKEAMQQEIPERGAESESVDSIHFADLKNGESLILE